MWQGTGATPEVAGTGVVPEAAGDQRGAGSGGSLANCQKRWGPGIMLEGSTGSSSHG